GPAPLRCFVVLDEAHKLAFGSGSPVEKILREGRKFGLGVILASQQPEDFSTVAFANTATKIVFQTADNSGHVSRELHRKVRNGHSQEYISKTLGTLPRGSAYVVIANTGHVTRMLSFDDANGSAMLRTANPGSFNEETSRLEQPPARREAQHLAGNGARPDSRGLQTVRRGRTFISGADCSGEFAMAATTGGSYPDRSGCSSQQGGCIGSLARPRQVRSSSRADRQQHRCVESPADKVSQQICT